MNIKPTNQFSGIPKVTKVTEVRVTPNRPQPQHPILTHDDLKAKTISELLEYASAYYGLTIPYNMRKAEIIRKILKEQRSIDDQI